jgi:alpha-1,2-mannosyltransferase
MALWKYYHAPMTVVYEFEHHEVPRLLNVTGHIYVGHSADDEQAPRIDLSPVKDFGLKLCIGKEWYRFPGSYLIPEGIRVDWVKSEFDGLLPGHFEKVEKRTSLLWFADGTRVIPKGMNDLNHEEAMHHVSCFTLCY